MSDELYYIDCKDITQNDLSKRFYQVLHVIKANLPILEIGSTYKIVRETSKNLIR